MFKKTIFAAAVAAGIAVPLAVDAARADSFTCSFKEAANAPKDLPPIKGLEEDMTQVEGRKHLAELVGDLAIAKIPPALIVDHLVWAYCPLVANDASLSDTQKTDRVRRFASQVAALVYTPPDAGELDVLVDLPLPPAVLGEIDKDAKSGGISRDAWMKQAIEKALGAP